MDSAFPECRKKPRHSTGVPRPDLVARQVRERENLRCAPRNDTACKDLPAIFMPIFLAVALRGGIIAA